MSRLAALFVVLTSCGGLGGGTRWIQEPLVPEEERGSSSQGSYGSTATQRPRARTLGQPSTPENRDSPPDDARSGGRVLGTFRNTYYDFPSESDFNGPPVSLMSAKCEPLAKVPKGFFDAVCVQGSGQLARGGTVSFAKRDCACAEICPRTNQRICFDALDKTQYPWGRGAAGTPIAPLRTVAADTQVLPMGTVIYLPELDGLGSDGCFVVEDRGLRVQGEHVDIFTGHPDRTAALNAQLPSNHGVTVIVGARRCDHLQRSATQRGPAGATP